MADENNNINQDKKIDKLQFQMEGVLEALKKVDENQKETNSRLETMQKGFVGREEYKEFQGLVGKLATQKDLDTSDKRIDALEEWNRWAIRIVLTVVILAVLGTVIITNKL